MYWSKTSTELAPEIGLGRGHSGETIPIGVEASNMCNAFDASSAIWTISRVCPQPTHRL